MKLKGGKAMRKLCKKLRQKIWKRARKTVMGGKPLFEDSKNWNVI